MPGPVCYGRGGTRATLTDVFVTLGYINDVALAGGSIRVDAEAGRAALNDQVADPLGQDLMPTARGVLALAVTTMTRAVKAVSTYRGRDPREFTLVAFGGNGPVVAADSPRRSASAASSCRVRRACSARSASCARMSSRNSCGPCCADAARMPAGTLQAIKQDLQERARRALASEGYDLAAADFRFSADLRYFGQAYELNDRRRQRW